MDQGSSSNQRDAYSRLRELIAQNTTLLFSLNEVPGKEKKSKLRNTGHSYQLTIDREKELSSDFALLAAGRVGRGNVVAVAIEEDQDKHGMTIRIAANEGDLTDVQSGLTNIAQVLERAATRAESRSVLQPHLLSKIIELDSGKILSRLRSKHAPSGSVNPGRRSIIRLLNNHVQDAAPTHIVKGNMSLAELQNQSRILMAEFEQLELMQAEELNGNIGRNKIAEILQRIAAVKEVDLAHFLQGCDMIDPTLIKSLPLTMAKIADYYKLSHGLIDAARDSKYSIFQNVRVVILDATAFLKTKVVTQDHAFDEVLLRYRSRIPESMLVTKARQKPWALGGKKGQWKVHAEIQLLSFYEFQDSPVAPRMLSASKGACYLCNLFIHNHGKFQVPWTHGRLYSPWTLPDIPVGIESASFLKTAHKFNQCLENEIRKTLAGQYKIFPHPSESVPALHPPWSPCATLIISKANTHQRSETSTINQALANFAGASSQAVTTTSSEDKQGPSDLRSGISQYDTVARIVLQGTDSRPVIPLSTGESSSSNVQEFVQIDSTWQCFKLPPNSSELWCHYDGLDLFIQWEDIESASGADLWIGFKCVDQPENERTHTLENSLSLASLGPDGVDSTLGAAKSDGPLMIVWLNTILAVKLEYMKPPPDPGI